MRTSKEGMMDLINRKDPEGLDKCDRPYQVLVVDDSAVMRKIISQQLRAEAYEICGEASTGKEAVDLYKELGPNVVTMDINMPEMDGVEALKRILEYDEDARVVMLTSEGQKQIVLDAITMGAKGYIVKPPQKIKVCENVKKAIRA